MKMITTHPMFRRTVLALAFGFAATGAASSAEGDPFYDISTVKADTLSPGALVKTAGYPTSKLRGSVNSRIMYISVDGNGVSVATTAVVSIPNGTSPAGGWPVIAWAHGTVGVGKLCAPSMTDDLSRYLSYVQLMLSRGYAVVATDYSGLGTTGRHFYSNRISNARDVIEGVRAATTAYPALSKAFMVLGHSQGGLASLGVAETIGSLSIAPLQYKGSVAVAPGLGVVQTYFRDGERTGTYNATPFSYMLYYAFTMTLLDPSLSYADVLLPEAAAKMPIAEQQCLAELRTTLAATTSFPMNYVKSSFPNNRSLSDYSTKNMAGKVKTAGPVLIVSGSADPSITLDALHGFKRTSCAAGSSILLKTYSGANHVSILADAKDDVYAWIAQQFAGTQVPTSCDN